MWIFNYFSVFSDGWVNEVRRVLNAAEVCVCVLVCRPPWCFHDSVVLEFFSVNLQVWWELMWSQCVTGKRALMKTESLQSHTDPGSLKAQSVLSIIIIFIIFIFIFSLHVPKHQRGLTKTSNVRESVLKVTERGARGTQETCCHYKPAAEEDEVILSYSEQKRQKSCPTAGFIYRSWKQRIRAGDVTLLKKKIFTEAFRLRFTTVQILIQILLDQSCRDRNFQE